MMSRVIVAVVFLSPILNSGSLRAQNFRSIDSSGAAAIGALLEQTQGAADGTLIEALRLQNAARLPDAEALLRRALLSRRQNGIRDVLTADLTNRLGTVLEDEGHFPEAEACFRQAASEFERLLGPSHPRFAIALANLGDSLVEEGAYLEAYSFIRRAIDIAAPVLGDCHPTVAVMFSDLAHLFYREKEIARAFPNARRALACLEKQGVESVKLGEAHHNLAYLYLDDGQFSLAQEHLDRANAILASLVPPGHPDLLFTANTNVVLYHKQGRYKEARQLGLALIEQVRGKLGPAHPSLGVMLANLGYSDQKLQLYQEAAECFQQAIAIEKQVHSQSAYLAELLRSYAAALRKTNRRPEAKKMELQAKAILVNSIR
jgi:tetratricopeptide (TPR) repeat protein